MYSFRRCPYAIRARLALAAAGLQPGQDLELREVSLKAKPPELLEASAKGTVPVLVLGAQVLGVQEVVGEVQFALAGGGVCSRPCASRCSKSARSRMGASAL